MTDRRRFRPGAVLGVVALLSVLTALGCRDDTTSSTPFGGPLTASPTAGAAHSAEPEQIEITISDGDFDSREIRVVAQVPTMMRVTNEDDQSYVLRVGDMITETEIPSGETVDVDFSSDVPETYEAELLDGPDGEVVATTTFVVAEPGGGTP